MNAPRPRITDDPRIAAALRGEGGLRAEDGPLLTWERFQYEEPLTLGRRPSDKVLRMGIGESGSQNHPPMRASAYLLCYLLAPGQRTADQRRDADAVAARAVEQFQAQREQGHKVQEAVTGYEAFHVGAAATLAIVGRVASTLSELWGPPLWQHALGWWADHLALLRALRCPDGQILHVGARSAVHEAPGERWQEVPPAIVAQRLDPLPRGELAPWIAALLDAEGRETAATHPGSSFGWLKPASVRPAVCLRQVLRAVRLGALPVKLLRQAAEGRRPRVCEALYVADTAGQHHAAMLHLRGGPKQVHWSSWTGGLAVTHVATSLRGFGRHDPPAGMPVGQLRTTTPWTGPEVPIPELPALPGGEQPAPPAPAPAPKPPPGQPAPAPPSPPLPGTPQPEPPRGGDDEPVATRGQGRALLAYLDAMIAGTAGRGASGELRRRLVKTFGL